MTLGSNFVLFSILSLAFTANPEGLSMSKRASGTFDVTVTPQGTADKAEGASLGRMSLDKQFQGDLTGTGKGEMLTAMTDTKGSAGYVAIERVSGHASRTQWLVRAPAQRNHGSGNPDVDDSGSARFRNR